MASEEIDPWPHKYWPSVESLKAYGQKNLQATLLFVDFTKAFDSIHREKKEQILLVYGLPKETVAAITILYRNTKVKVGSPDGDTEYFDIVAGVLQGGTLAPYLFIICGEDKFTYLWSSVLSTEKDIDTRLTKAWTAIDKLSINLKSDLTDKMKQFLPNSGHIDTAIWMHYLEANKQAEQKLDGNYTRMLRAIINKSWRQHPTKH